MFIKVTQAGNRRYAQLVESFRNEEGKPRQRTICTLGRLDRGGEVDHLIAALQRARGENPTDPLEEVRFLASRHAGDIWALFQLWLELGFEDLAKSWKHSKTEVDVLGCLRLMVFNRLCDPSSKLGVLRWLETVALPMNFGFTDDKPEHHHLLRAMDVIDDHSEALDDRLATLMRPLIDQELSVVFYDLTTIEVAGEKELPEDLRAYGMSKSGMVARQWMLSLVQTSEGLPIAHDVHPGNTGEAKTLIPMIEGLLKRYPLKKVILIADRGLLSVNNLNEIESLQDKLSTKGHEVKIEYIMAVPAARYGDFAEDIKKLSDSQPSDKKWCAQTEWKNRRMVIAHDPESAQRRTRKRNQEIADLVKLGAEWSGKLDQQDVIDKKGRGRPLSDSGAKARFYHAVKDAKLAHLIEVDLKGDLFNYSIDEERKSYLELLDGKLLLVTNTDLESEEVVRRYKSLADIERGFRVLKSDIEIGPIYHRLPKRIRAHALVCFMALILYRVMRMRLKAANRTESPARLLEQLKQIQQQTIKTPSGNILNGLTEISPLQKSLFSALELKAPTPKNLSAPHL